MKANRFIKIIGAREHNLKNITVEIPKESLTVVTGPSGSGKSTLALDVLYAEGQRRYMESLSSYARQFLGMPKKPDVDSIQGLCPAIAIEQKTVGANPRSTVGTITELYDYLRVLFARIGELHCPSCYNPIQSASAEQIAERLVREYAGLNVSIVAPLVNEKKGSFVTELEKYFKEGFYRFIIDGQRVNFRSPEEIQNLNLKKTFKHTIDIALDTLEVSLEETSRIQESLEKAFSLANGQVKIIVGENSFTYSSSRMCVPCNSSIPELEPRLFSFNSPIGACKKCHGLGVEIILPWAAKNSTLAGLEFADKMGVYQEITCSTCKGERLNQLALAVTIGGKNIFQVGELSVVDALTFFNTVKLSEFQVNVSKRLLHEIVQRYQFLFDVGLSYLNLNRTARTLSGGEGQRIRLATQIGSALSGVVYVLDEPSIGLHQKDNDKLIHMLLKLRDQGNTVVVVEHDSDTMKAADYIIDMGPAAGKFGGEVVAAGTPAEIMKNKKSLSGAYLSGRETIERIVPLREPTGFITLHDATVHNLKNLSVKFPLGLLCGITGVSGSGKSSLIMDELVPALQKTLSRNKRASFEVDKIEGVDQLENLVVIDQKPIGRTSRSNPATYLGIFDDIRKLYASLPESNARGYTMGHFSFNVGAGRCAECAGEGTITVSMHFLPDVVMECTRCKGKRYTKSVLEITYKGKSIADILEMTAIEALEFFAAHTSIAKRIKLMCDVGLDYLALGQSSTTLSGGEAQRIKLVDELAKRGSKTLYILDEPTTGLHAHDIKRLLGVFERLLVKGNSLIVIEHNLDVLKVADYIIDLGPDGGDKGGNIVAFGTPAQVAACKESYTGAYLKPLLKK
jgi:excinuclease ABC subunit A